MLAVLLMAGGSVPPSGGATGRSPDPGPQAVPLGAFLGSDARGADRIDAFAAWLGTDVTVGHTYLPGGPWRDLEGPGWLLDPWTAWRSAEPGRTL
ncbi:MAG TPA: hypothetical protein VHN18_04575, partial [Micromonosporaceae bacterium]|nr:hypothetical protein [Micromonosporaceae bacterium]